MADASAHKPRGNNKEKKGELYHSRNNAAVWQEHQLAHRQRIKRDMGQVKEGEAHT